MIYVDANYWIYWFDQRLPEHKYVVEPMRAAIREGVLLNLISMFEVAHYFRHLPPEELQGKMETIQNLSTLTLVDLNRDIARAAVEKLKKYAGVGMGGRDSVILATMEVEATRRIATHDEVFKRVEGLEVIDTVP